MQPPVSLREPAWLREFKAFLMRGSVVDLAVGLVIGAAFTTIVTSLVEDLINPLIGLAIGGVDFSNIFIVLKGERQASLEATRQGGAAVLAIGNFLNTIIEIRDRVLRHLLGGEAARPAAAGQARRRREGHAPGRSAARRNPRRIAGAAAAVARCL